MTEGELIAKAAARGVRLEPRTLTSWRTKGLLPALSVRGAGRGKGKLYAWADSDVLNQALAIAALFKRRYRTEFAHLALWHAGYKVDAIRARQIWLQRLNNIQKQIDQDAEHVGSRESLLAKMADRIILALNVPVQLKHVSLDGLVSVAVNSIYSLGDMFDIDAEYATIAEIFRVFAAIASERSKVVDSEQATVPSESAIVRFEKAFSRSFSLQSRIDALVQASETDLRALSDFLRRSRVLIGNLHSVPPGAQPLPEIGELAVALYLSLQRAGFETRIKETLQLFELAAAGHGLSASAGSAILKNIWRDLSLTILLKRLAAS